MPSIRLEDLTAFGRLALKLDREFAELARAGAQMEKVDLESDSGLDEGLKLLNRVALQGQSLAETMREFSQAMQEARDGAEAATKLVADRAQLIQRRRQQQDELQGKLARLKEELQTLGASVAASSPPQKGALSEDDKRRIAAALERLDAPMARFIEAAQTIKTEAGRAKFRRLERQAESMIDSLQASRRKIAQAIAPKQAGG